MWWGTYSVLEKMNLLCTPWQIVLPLLLPYVQLLHISQTRRKEEGGEGILTGEKKEIRGFVGCDLLVVGRRYLFPFFQSRAGSQSRWSWNKMRSCSSYSLYLHDISLKLTSFLILLQFFDAMLSANLTSILKRLFFPSRGRSDRRVCKPVPSPHVSDLTHLPQEEPKT